MTCVCLVDRNMYMFYECKRRSMHGKGTCEYSMNGNGNPCMMHSWKGRSMHDPWMEMEIHACCMRPMHDPCMEMEIHAWCMRPMHDPCMIHAWKWKSMRGAWDPCMIHAWFMHFTCVHAWNLLKHACFMHRISSREEGCHEDTQCNP